MDKQERIRLIINKVSELEHEAFCMGIFSNDTDQTDYERHYQYKRDLIVSLYDLLEDLL